MSKRQIDANTTGFEVPPEDDWFLEITGPNQELLVYFRFQATGLLTRRMGPFPSRRTALAWLNVLVWKVGEAMDGDLFNKLQDQVMTLPWNHRGECVFLEDPFTFRPGPHEATQPQLPLSQSKRNAKKSTTNKRKGA